MQPLDRLSALMARFELSVTATEIAQGNLLVLADAQSGCAMRLILRASGSVAGFDTGGQSVLLSARVDWGGTDNPLLTALPETLEHALCDDDEIKLLTQLLVDEHNGARCGSKSVINRLGEVLVVRLLRRQLEAGSLRVGLLGGLADKRLSRAIVAMHERPERVWSVDDLAEIAGLSVSRFAQLFKAAVGQSPLSYLRKWRLVLAKQDIERGDRVSSTALRYGYGSSEAMSRAFYQQYRIKPVALRKQMAEGLAGP